MKFVLISFFALTLSNFAIAQMGMSKSAAWGSNSEDGSISACRENYSRITDGLALGCRNKSLVITFSPCKRIREANVDEVKKYANIQPGYFMYETSANYDCK